MSYWDLLWKENPGAFYGWPNEDLVRWASSLESGSRVLEVGCGQGANLWALQSFDLDPWGVDIAEEAVRRSAGAPWASQVKVGSVIELEFPSESFDAVCDVQCFQHLAQDELPLAYKEAARVLRPGGRFFEVFMLAGQQHFPDLRFCEFDQAPIEAAGLMHTHSGWMERSWGGRLYSYQFVECERV